MPSKPQSDVVRIAADLIRCPSVTPEEAGALDILERFLEPIGFTVHRMAFSHKGTPDVENLYARIGTGEPHLCFAGHVDVVPPGDQELWSQGPFDGTVKDGVLFGRGAVDMKGAVACFAAACERFFAGGPPDRGSVSFLITGDEEGPAINGTRKLLEWVGENDQTPDHCLLGEPTNPTALGQTLKVGRRGSLNARLTVNGVQGHVAYPDLAINPITGLLEMLRRLTNEPFDEGSENFQPTNLEISSVDVGNSAENVIPSSATARFNVRFSDRHTSDSLKRLIEERCQEVAAETGGSHALDFHVSGEWFLAEQDGFSDLVAKAVEDITGRVPEKSTSGGTSDGRFIKNYCPVIEFGLVGETMHKVDECVAVEDLEALTAIYIKVLERYFSASPDG